MVLLVFIGVLVVAILAWLKTASVAYTDENRMTTTALYAMLNSNDCTPKTKMTFKTMLAVGIAEGRHDWEDVIDLNYSGTSELDEVVLFYGPPKIYGYIPVTVKECILNFQDRGLFGTPGSFSYFYVEHPSCPDGKCFEHTLLCTDRGICQSRRTPNQLLDRPPNIETYEFIALPNGDTAKVVLKTSG